MKKIEAVIFDCDGVVVDSTELQKQAEQDTAISFAEEHSLDYDPEITNWDAMQGWARKKIAAAIYGIPADSEQADAFRLAVVDTTVEIACPDNTPLIPGVEAFADYMALRGLKLGLATASNRKIYSRYCELNAMDFFSPRYIVAHDECRDNKPKPGPFLEVMRRMHVAPERTLVIEDSGSGITAGRYAGAIVLGLATTKPLDYLRAKTDAHLVAEDFQEATRQLQPLLA
ncbi:MAG: HAD family phosphatase [Candidatus Saccharimonadales bacterium]